MAAPECIYCKAWLSDKDAPSGHCIDCSEAGAPGKVYIVTYGEDVFVMATRQGAVDVCTRLFQDGIANQTGPQFMNALQDGVQRLAVLPDTKHEFTWNSGFRRLLDIKFYRRDLHSKCPDVMKELSPD